MDKDAKGPQRVDWHYNVANRQAEEFYRQHGAIQVDKGFELEAGSDARELMRTRYCLLHELGRCRKKCPNTDLKFPLWLYNDKRLFPLEFDCGECFMKVMQEK